MTSESKFTKWTKNLQPEKLSADLFLGKIFVFKDLKPFEIMCDRARQVVEKVLGRNPIESSILNKPEEFQYKALKARKIISSDQTVNYLWEQTTRELGYKLDTLRKDRLRLRIVPSSKDYYSRFIRPLPPHRDIWGSGIMAQINWWTPLYPVTKYRTIVLWPDSFRRRIKNNSDDWDYDTAKKSGTNCRLLPTATSKPFGQSFEIDIQPNTLIAFSGAHLHGSVTDNTKLCRIGLDTRTVWDQDLKYQRGAPNIDSMHKTARWEMFERSNNEKNLFL